LSYARVGGPGVAPALAVCQARAAAFPVRLCWLYYAVYSAARQVLMRCLHVSFKSVAWTTRRVE